MSLYMNDKEVGIVVPTNPPLQSKSVTPSAQAQTVSADSGYYGLSDVSIGAIEFEAPHVIAFAYVNAEWDKKKITVDASRLGIGDIHNDYDVACNSAFENQHGILEEIELRSDNEFFLKNYCDYMFYSDIDEEGIAHIKKIKMPNANTKYLLGCLGMFEGCRYLEEIDCVFDLSNIGNNDGGSAFRQMFNACERLREVRFKPNTINVMGYQIFNVSQVFSDETIVSIANGLRDGVVSSNTLALLSTPKARCSTLMGTVSLDETSTYHIFTEDHNGDTTLADFITNVKGWTLA